jgi:glutamyl-tRNA reductase
MLDDLVIVNLRHGSLERKPSAHSNLEWQTCLRRIVFLHRTELSILQTGMDVRMNVYRGQKACQFLLEVICGLHSPVLGETAVMGQFRKFRANAKFAATPWGHFLRKFITDLLVDARYIRAHYLQGLGSQSYGSLIRNRLKGIPRVALLGTGSLAQEILPWLIGETDVRMFHRSLLHAKRMLDEYDQIQLDQFTMADAGWEGEPVALVIAAPLNSAEIDNWLELQSVSFSPTLDLRDNAATDPIYSSPLVIKLSELFASLRQERKRLETCTAAALAKIELLAWQHAQRQQWQAFEAEDLCA